MKPHPVPFCVICGTILNTQPATITAIPRRFYASPISPMRWQRTHRRKPPRQPLGSVAGPSCGSALRGARSGSGCFFLDTFDDT